MARLPSWPYSVDMGREGPDIHETFVEQVSDVAMFIVGADGRVLTWNRGAERLFGYRPEEMRGRPFTSLLPSEGRDQHAWERGLDRGREGGRTTTGWFQRKDGTRLWATRETVALGNGLAPAVGVVVCNRTDAKQAEDHLQRLTRDLEDTLDALRVAQELLNDKVRELERVEEAVVSRELKMATLEREVERLRQGLTKTTGSPHDAPDNVQREGIPQRAP